LFDPIHCHLKYIGKSQNPKDRCKGHIEEAKKGLSNTHKDNWIKQLLSKGLEPSFEVLEECTEETWQEAEIKWIKECRENGIDLTNVLDGGNEPPNLRYLPNRDEIRKKMSHTRKIKGIKPPGFKGLKHSQETKQRQSESIGAYYQEHDHPLKGKNLSLKHKENIIKAWKEKGIYGKPWTYFVSEERAKEGYQKRNNNPNWRENLSKTNKIRLSDPTKNSMYGKKQSTKSKEKNRISNLMYDAYKKDNYSLIAELQEDYFEVAGCYQPNYAEFSYSQFI
jgi:hypothetical protein